MEVRGAGTEGRWWLTISNPVSPPVQNALAEGGLSEIRSRISATETGHAIRTEGGSGFGKILNQLSSIDEAYRIEVNLREASFEVKIGNG